MNGMEMMLKSMGVDPGKIMQDFTNLKEGVTKELKEIREHLSTIAKQNTEILEGNKRIEGNQVRAWQKILEVEAQQQPLQTVQQQQPSAPVPLNP